LIFLKRYKAERRNKSFDAETIKYKDLPYPYKHSYLFDRLGSKAFRIEVKSESYLKYNLHVVIMASGL
jgi:hypothetical protein